LLSREDKDHKIIATRVDDVRFWDDIPEDEKDLIEKYFGYKSKIISIEGEERAIEMIREFEITKD